MKTKYISKRVTKLLEERVLGFNDHYAYFECVACDEKYAYIDFAGNDWIVDEY